MDQGHPEPEMLARYARGALRREEGRALEEHLADCLTCQEAVDALPTRSGSVVRWQGHRFTRKEGEEPVPEGPDRRETVRGVLRALGDVLAATSETAAARLLSQPEHRRRALIREDERLHTLGLCELLEARCRESWLEDPDEAVENAKLAVLIAQKLSPEAYGARRVEDARALAWVHLGTSFRLASESLVAEGAEPADQDAYPTGAIGASVLRDGAGRLRTVESALRETRAACFERGLEYDAALVTLDLASALLRGDRSDEIAPLAGEAAGLFSEPYLAQAMRFLQGSAEGEEVTPELMDRMALLLQRRRSGAAERFE